MRERRLHACILGNHSDPRLDQSLKSAFLTLTASEKKMVPIFEQGANAIIVKSRNDL